MPEYHIHRLKESRRNRFRTVPHTSGEAVVAPVHYEPHGTADAASPYALWSKLLETDERLVVGDLLETAEGELRIFKYVGFEKARWEEPSKPEAAEPEPSLTQTA